MSDGTLDLLQLEADRRPVKIDDGDVVLMASPDGLSPRDFAKIGAMEKVNADPDSFSEEAAEELELRMTDAACVLLPDTDRERVDAMPFMRKARLVQAFMGALSEPQRTPERDDTPDGSTSES